MSPSEPLYRAVLCLAMGLGTLLALTTGNAGTPAPRALTEQTRQAVNKGVELEQHRRWVDAVMHYEQAVKQWPGCDELEYGMRRAKVHLAVDRRYTDDSFQRGLLALTRPQAQGLFEDICQRAQSQYVEAVSLTSFVAHGTESLYQALDEPRFVEANVSPPKRSRAKQVRQTLKTPGEFWNRRITDREEARRFIEEVCRMCQAELEMSPTAVWLEYVFGGCNALDDYSGLLTPGRYRDLMSNIHGEFVGLGVEIKAVPGRGLLLVNVLPGSPAAEGGLLAGEHIVSIDGTDVRQATTDESAGLLQGESGSIVKLDVQREEQGSPRTLRLTRRAVVIRSIPVARLVDTSSGVAYIQLASFQDSTVQELDAALGQLQRQGMQSLILDVRGNPGGLLTAAVEVLDRFIDDGVLVQIRGRTQNEVYRAKAPGTWRVPVVLLMDGDSASASEIVAGAFRDHKRATIVGRRSFGKWSVQSILPVRDRCGLRITTAKFYSPRGQNLAKVGLRPDIEVPEPPRPRHHFRAPDEVDLGTDEDVQQALRLLTNEVAAR